MTNKKMLGKLSRLFSRSVYANFIRTSHQGDRQTRERWLSGVPKDFLMDYNKLIGRVDQEVQDVKSGNLNDITKRFRATTQNFTGYIKKIAQASLDKKVNPIWSFHVNLHLLLKPLELPLCWLEHVHKIDAFELRYPHFSDCLNWVQKGCIQFECRLRETKGLNEELTKDYITLLNSIVSRLNVLIRQTSLDLRHRNIDYKQLFPNEMKEYLSRKNKKHIRYNGPFNGKILYTRNPDLITNVASNTYKDLMSLIQDIKRRWEPRTQVIFVCNTWLSHSIALDIGLHPDTGKLCIFAFDSSYNVMFYRLLKKVEHDFPQASVYASQTHLQKDFNSCMVYAYLTLCESAKCSIETIIGHVSRSNQNPLFMGVQSKSPEKMPKLNHVKWFDFNHIPWAKAHRSCQGYGTLTENLEQLTKRFGKLSFGDYPDKKSTQAIIHHQKEKYGSDKNKFAYRKGEKIFQRVHHKATEITLDDIKKELMSKNEKNKGASISVETLLRRSAAGFGPKRLLRRLIDILNESGKATPLDSQSSRRNDKKTDKPCGLVTALHLAEASRNERRCLMLLEAGANPSINNQAKRSVCDIINEDPNHPFRKNKKIMGYF